MRIFLKNDSSEISPSFEHRLFLLCLNVIAASFLSKVFLLLKCWKNHNLSSGVEAAYFLPDVSPSYKIGYSFKQYCIRTEREQKMN